MYISYGRWRETGFEEAGDPDRDVFVCHLRQWSRSPAGEYMLAEDALVGGPGRLQMTLGCHPLRGEVLDLDVPQARVNVGARLDGRVDVPQIIVREVLRVWLRCSDVMLPWVGRRRGNGIGGFGVVLG